jgi:nitroreductase
MERTHLERLVQDRRSVRRFLEEPVPREKITACLEAARLAPSAENVQPWRFVVLDDPAVRAEFSRAVFGGIYSPTRFAAKAPVLILVLSKPDIMANRLGKQVQGVAFHLIDIGIAGEHIVLAAQEQGIGTCWIGWFNPRRARKFFGIPRSYKPVAILAMGYPALPGPHPRPRKPLAEIAWFNGFRA